jgi:hypothetical protein
LKLGRKAKQEQDLAERIQLQFRAAFSNLFNHAQFENPSAFAGASSDFASSNFGEVVRARSAPGPVCAETALLKSQSYYWPRLKIAGRSS